MTDDIGCGPGQLAAVASLNNVKRAVMTNQIYAALALAVIAATAIPAFAQAPQVPYGYAPPAAAAAVRAQAPSYAPYYGQQQECDWCDAGTQPVYGGLPRGYNAQGYTWSNSPFEGPRPSSAH